MEQKREFLFKVLVIGELATGKTALVNRYVQNIFTGRYQTTVIFVSCHHLFSQ